MGSILNSTAKLEMRRRPVLSQVRQCPKKIVKILVDFHPESHRDRPHPLGNRERTETNLSKEVFLRAGPRWPGPSKGAYTPDAGTNNKGGTDGGRITSKHCVRKLNEYRGLQTSVGGVDDQHCIFNFFCRALHDRRELSNRLAVRWSSKPPRGSILSISRQIFYSLPQPGSNPPTIRPEIVDTNPLPGHSQRVEKNRTLPIFLRVMKDSSLYCIRPEFSHTFGRVVKRNL